MNNLDGRVGKLEQEQAPKDQVIYVLYYSPVTGRVTGGDHPELIGLTQEEVRAQLDKITDKNVVQLIVVSYIPENGRK